jgi:uroporphyrinogen-III synthase
VDPVLAVRPTDDPLPDIASIKALVATSAHGVKALGRLSGALDLPLYCLSGASGEAAKALGFAHSKAAGEDARALCDNIRHTLSPQNGALLWARGAHISFDIKAALCERGFSVQTWQAYEAHAAAALKESTLAAIRDGKIKAVMLHSARGAKAFVKLAQGENISLSGLGAITLSQNVAQGINNAGFARIVCAKAPNERAMMEAVHNLSPH